MYDEVGRGPEILASSFEPRLDAASRHSTQQHKVHGDQTYSYSSVRSMVSPSRDILRDAVHVEQAIGYSVWKRDAVQRYPSELYHLSAKLIRHSTLYNVSARRYAIQLFCKG